MALTVYLLHANDGRLREHFLSYVESAYRGRARSTSALSRALEVPYKELDASLAKFLAEGLKPG
jgi:hypothetical protein